MKGEDGQLEAKRRTGKEGRGFDSPYDDSHLAAEADPEEREPQRNLTNSVEVQIPQGKVREDGSRSELSKMKGKEKSGRVSRKRN